MSDVEAIRAAIAGTGKPSSDFDLNPAYAPPDADLRPAGVLALLVPGQTGFDLVLTKRSSRLKHHPGQIAFPGGKKDPGDRDLIATALREAREEVGLVDHGLDILGTLPPHRTVTGFSVTPVVAVSSDRQAFRREEAEVEEIFVVPLAHVMEPANYLVTSRLWRGQQRAYFAVPYGPYYIWGATARMLRAWADRLQKD